MKKLPPEHWKDLSLRNIPNEMWAKCDFTDTDGKRYDFGDSYMVSSMGRIKSLDRMRQIREGCKIKITGRICKPDNLNGAGYLRIRLTNKKHAKAFLVHRLVMLCFAEKIKGKKKVNHKKGIKWDNRLRALEWSTHPENIQHAFDTGLHRGYPGEESGTSKITNKTAMSIFLASGTQHEIARKFKVSRGVVCSIKRGNTWSTVTGKEFVKQRIPLSKKDILDIRGSELLATELAKKYKKSLKLIRSIRNATQ